MQNKPLPQIIEGQLRQKKSVRTFTLRATAALVLVAFTTVVLHGNWLLAVVLIGGGVGVWKLYEEQDRRRQCLDLLHETEAQSEEEFLRTVTDLLRTQGYGILKARQADHRRADLLLMTRGDESVACRTLRHRVTTDEIAKTLTAMRLYGCRRSMVITSRAVTVSARYVARRSGCVVIDRWGLVHLMMQYRQGHRVYAFQRAEERTSARKNG
jgi:Restriction endonuclease